jgi:hypothetical protein
LAQQELEKKASAIDVLFSIRERNRKMSMEEYLEKLGLRDKFEKFTRKKDPKSR